MEKLIRIQRQYAVLLCIALASVLLPSMPLLAEKIYKWRDANGTLHFSDRPPPRADPVPQSRPEKEIEREPKLGMSYKEIITLLGHPSFIFRSPDANRLRLVYGNDFFFLIDGLLTASKPLHGPRQRDLSKVYPGLGYDAVLDTWGSATQETVTVSRRGIHIELLYRDSDDSIFSDHVYLENGVVTYLERKRH